MIPGMLEGALIAASAFAAGQLIPRPHRRHPKPPKPPQPVCGCTHHHAYHDPQTGECNAAVNGKPTHRDSRGYADAWEQVPCGCVQYSGPQPLPEYYAPEIAS